MHSTVGLCADSPPSSDKLKALFLSNRPKPVLRKNNGQVSTLNTESSQSKNEYKIEIKWRNVILLTYLHIAGIYGFFISKRVSTLVIGWTLGILAGYGTTVGSHRLFTHRTFKANNKMKWLLMLLQTMAGQEPVIRWARDHRVHHKFTDTNADPYNSRRGFFFAHVGWLLCKKHPDVLEQGKKVDMSDLVNDPIMKFQQKYFVPMTIFFTFVLPIVLVCYFGESFHVAWYGNIYRYVLGLNLVWMVNSVAHLWGAKPYDKNISPTDTYLVGFCSLGEGWHNYHHIFPWDYKTSELPSYGFNISTAFIDFFAWLGWATDLKTVPRNMIKDRILRTGDGSHRYSKKTQGKNDDSNNDRDIEHFWGFGDKTMTKDDMRNVKILKKTFS